MKLIDTAFAPEHISATLTAVLFSLAAIFGTVVLAALKAVDVEPMRATLASVTSFGVSFWR